MFRSIITRTIITPLMWLVDLYSITQDTGKQIAWDLVGESFRRASFDVVADGVSAADATTVKVDPIAYPLKKGTVLHFGSKKFAKLTADVDAEETDLPVEALGVAIADGDTATAFVDTSRDGFGNASRHAKFIPSGTVMVEVPGEDYKIIPMADDMASTEQGMVLISDAKEDSKTDSLTGYGVIYSGICYENLMPDAIKNGGTLPSAMKTKLGNRFIWRRSVDSRGA